MSRPFHQLGHRWKQRLIKTSIQHRDGHEYTLKILSDNIGFIFDAIFKPIVLTPLRNVRRLARVVEDFKQERRLQLKEERTHIMKRQLADQMREERETDNKENLHSTVIRVEAKKEPVPKQVEQKTEQVKAEATRTHRKPNKRDEFVFLLNELEPEQLKNVKVWLPYY